VLAASGDSVAIDALLRMIDRHGLARAAIARQLFDRQDQEDVGQDVLLLVANSITGFRGEAHVLTWLHQLATNAALGFVRRRSREPLPAAELPLSGCGLFSSIVSDRADLRLAIDDLPAHYRQAVILRDVHQLPYAEIAEQLGLNLNTVRSHIARGRAAVAAQLAPVVLETARGDGG